MTGGKENIATVIEPQNQFYQSAWKHSLEKHTYGEMPAFSARFCYIFFLAKRESGRLGAAKGREGSW